MFQIRVSMGNALMRSIHFLANAMPDLLDSYVDQKLMSAFLIRARAANASTQLIRMCAPAAPVLLALTAKKT